MTTKIYALQDETGRIRYIGKTSRSLSERFKYHLKDARLGQNNHRCCWIRSLLARGVLPTITEIGEVEGDGCKEEVAWIKYFRDEGVCLVNGTDGGDGVVGLSPSVETRQKLSQANKGRVPWIKGRHHSEEVRRKISAASAGRIISQEVRLKMTGRVMSPETRMKMSIAKRNMSIETRRKMSAAKKNMSEDTREKIRVAQLGRHHTVEARRRIGIASKMRMDAPGARNKQSEANKAAWARIREQKK